ncbi:hypothetical protein KAM621c_24040 [Citrobacter braakii]|uniref:Uncharacterized protein n=1 Tax=Citrobacter braakii TaxID=57706 RepID=A0AAD1P2C1_CITBR|nr:hypothetical protein KAM621c_24040 [Citrobacter braakii]HEE0062758.1 hypothetical protein [Citrobacter braakii]HEE9823267.1 hypothetical protein [Citrobacter braakii]
MRGGAKFETKGFDRVIRQRFAALAGITLTVGIHRGKENNGVDVATYGAWNNFGTKNAMGWELIPERPFMRFASDRIADWMESAAYKDILRDVMLGKLTAQQAIARIGAQAVAITRKTIADSALYRPNSAITIARKGSTKPLIQSGTLIQTVNYKATS